MEALRDRHLLVAQRSECEVARFDVETHCPSLRPADILSRYGKPKLCEDLPGSSDISISYAQRLHPFSLSWKHVRTPDKVGSYVFRLRSCSQHFFHQQRYS